MICTAYRPGCSSGAQQNDLEPFRARPESKCSAALVAQSSEQRPFLATVDISAKLHDGISKLSAKPMELLHRVGLVPSVLVYDVGHLFPVVLHAALHVANERIERGA